MYGKLKGTSTSVHRYGGSDGGRGRGWWLMVQLEIDESVYCGGREEANR